MDDITGTFGDWFFVIPGSLFRELQRRDEDKAQDQRATATEARDRRIVNRRIDFGTDERIF